MRILYLIFAVCLAPPSWAEAPRVAAPSVNSALLQTLFGLMLVLALIFVLAWMSKRLSYGAASHKTLKIVAVLPLGTREKALLVDVAGTQMLLGVAPGRVSTLHVFDEPAVDIPAVETTPNKNTHLAARSVPEFAQKLQLLLSQGHKT